MDGSTRPDLRREAAGSALATLRTRLLDMSGRNPLISFPHARQSRSRACVRAVDGHLDILHEHLREGRPLPLLGLPAQEDEPGDERTDQFRAALETARSTDEEHQAALAGLAEDEFASRKAAGIERQLRDRVRETLGLPTWQAVTLKGLTEHATSLGIDPSFELSPTPPETGGDAQGTHVRLQALMLADPLERTLAKIRDTARTAAEESGLNTLHVAFGFLEWFESDGSDRLITSPLLLMQVDIDRRIVRSRYQYQLTGAGDETQVNLTLSERLDRDFRIKLPALGAEEAPEAYLARVLEEVCKGRRRWAVRRWMTLAHFPFARLAMFNDLDEALWEGPGGLAGHKLVGALLGGSESGQAWFAEEHDVDAPEVARAVPLLALDADASQYSAIIDVMAGQNLVIEGPPGTGKSQTITNLVAAALARGKRVLFMADKQAALQVVKDRIDAIGLGDFCLELHSGKARKRDVLDSLRRRLERRPGRSALDHLDERMRALTATRRDLTRYTNVLNSGLGSFGATVHDVLWADRRRRNEAVDAGRPLDALAVPDCEAITRSEIELRKSALDRLVRAAEPIVSRFGNPGAHPWRGMARSDLPAVDHEQVVREAEDVAAMLDTVADCASALRALGIDAAATIGGIQAVAAAISHLPVAPDVPSRFYRGLGSMAVRAAAQDWLRACEDYHSALAIVRDTGMAAAKTVGAAVAEALELIWAGLAASAPAGLTIAGLPGWLAGVHAEATRLQELARVAAQAASLFGLGAPGPSEDLAVVLRGSELARDAGETVIGFICPEFVARDNASVIARAAVEIAGLRTTAEALAANYSVAPATSPNVLRKHVAALREAGAFGFFSSSVKAAARAHAELQRRPGKLGRIATARALGEIAEHLEGVAALEERHDVRAAFGACYRGLATDVEAAVAVSGWATRVRDELAGFDDVTLNVRRTLTGGDAERLQAIAALDGGALRELADYVARQPGRSASIADTAAAVAARAAAIRALADACERHGLPAATLVSDMPELCQALRVATTAANKAQMPEQLSAALGRCGPAPLDDHASLRAALALAAEVAALPLDDAAKRMLHGAEPIALGSAFVPAARAVVEAVERGLAGWKRLKDTLALDEACFLGARILHLSPADAAGRLREAATHPSGLGEWTAFLIERRQAEGLGLGDLLSLWDAGATLGPLPAAFERMLYHALARVAFSRYPELDRMTGLGQDAAREQFKSLDADVTKLRRAALARDLARRAVPEGNGVGKRSEFTDEALIRHELGKQKRHIPLRQLFDRAGDAVQALKPCFMMSPLSVAQYLRPSGLRFDLLVIDEASQMRPEDALGAIARSSQIVVVGDPKQLPPTAFFNRSGDREDDDADAEEQVDAESILDLAQAIFRPMRRLRWHYRSRHGSLIAFSNREFYDDDLIVFPSPARADPSQGVLTVKVDGIYKSRSNVVEMEAVCAAAVEHMRRCPDRSLGIATMNQVQRDLIVQRMDHLAATHPEVDAYRERWTQTLERFFVKNLETVQGDERDVVFISTVFGPHAPGAKPSQVFGPINGPSGHRRLNVLFTRAKHHVRLFTSLTPDDVLVAPDGPRGAQVLRRYLAYALDGRIDGGRETGREADSDFEVFVRDRLRLAGYEAVPQVGVAGFFIDLAVRHPEMPDRFLVGIECDGASYHSSRSARDRDILRQQILEGLGWTIYRIWSTDWFRDPAGQTRKLVAFVEAALRAACDAQAADAQASELCRSTDKGMAEGMGFEPTIRLDSV